MSPHDEVLYFAFIAAERSWNSLNNGPVPSGKAWDIFCIPGKIAASGKSLEDAEANLNRLIAIAISLGGGPEKWYASAMQELNDYHALVFYQAFQLSFTKLYGLGTPGHRLRDTPDNFSRGRTQGLLHIRTLCA